MNTFERIQRDPRHGDVTVTAYEPIERRSFGNWSMVFVRPRPDDAAAYGDIITNSGFDPAKATGDEVLKGTADARF